MRVVADWREGLPFFPGRASLVEVLADQHVPPQGELSWADLLRAAVTALEETGRQLRSAATQQECGAAQVRWEVYSARMRDAEVALLGVAARRLAAGPLHDPATGRFAGLVSYGRRASGQALQPIPAAHWEAGEVDWAKWRLRVERVEWREVRVLELLLLTETQAAAVVDDLLPRSTHGVKARDDEVLAVLGPLVRDLAPGDPRLSREALFLAAKDELGKLGKAVAREQIDYFMSNHMPAGKRRPRGRPKRNSPKK